MYSALQPVEDLVKGYHKAPALLLRGLASLGIGPFGGENSVSAVIEALLALKKGQALGFELSKTDSFFVKQLINKEDIADLVIEYRELNHAAQQEVLDRWGSQTLGVIWVGAGVFTLEHPLLGQRKPADLHMWTDAHPKIVIEARAVFDEMKRRNEEINLSYNITLPQDIDKLNHCVEFSIDQGMDHIVLQVYGVNYALTMAESYQWLSQLHRPRRQDISVIFNAPGSLAFMPGVLAAFNQQRMVAYERGDIASLFEATMPGSEIVWTIPSTQTRNKYWETWLIHIPGRDNL